MIARPGRPLPASVWLLGPLLASAAAAVAFATPLRFAGLQAPEPVFALVPAFAWAFVRPSLWPSLALVGAGLFLDLLWGGPLGLWPLCLLAAHALAASQRRLLSGQGFWGVWAGYAAACAVAMAVGVALTAIRAGHAPGLLGVFWQFAASAALFPFAWRLLERYDDADMRPR